MSANKQTIDNVSNIGERQEWVDCDNPPLPKAVIHYWRNRIGIGGRQRIGTGGCFQSKWLAVFGRNTRTGGHSENVNQVYMPNSQQFPYSKPSNFLGLYVQPCELILALLIC